MRKFLLAASAATLALPAIPSVAFAHESGVYQGRTWRGPDGQTYCRRSNGTTGILVGGVGGALVGRAVDTHGDRATGTILGAAVGALLGREVQRGRQAARCR